jgi:Methyltransferase domain
VADQRIGHRRLHDIEVYVRRGAESGRDIGENGAVAEPDDVADAPRIEVLADLERPGGYVLLIDRVRQSYVDLFDPTYLDFEYMRWFAAIIDTLRPGPLAVTHIGAGAGAMVRWIDAVRPGSTHVVLEPDTELIDIVRRRLPFHRNARVRIRPLPGRPGLSGVRTDSADVVILDAFDGARVPADLTTRECLAEVARVLRDDGAFVANVGDGEALTYSKRLAAGLVKEVGEPAVISEKRVFGGARFGNVVLAAGPAGVDPAALRHRMAVEIVPAQLRNGPALRDWMGGAVPFTDADRSRSPLPPDSAWRVPR